MIKRFIGTVGILILLAGLGACRSTVSPAPTATRPATPTTSSARPKASPSPTVPWQVPQPQKDDWAVGRADARLVVVEYGDYQ